MRPQAEIRKHILRIRDKNELPLTLISERSRCTIDEIRAVLRLEGREETLIRLDAFLDAPDLHVQKQETRLLYQIEELDRELYREFGLRTMHPLKVQRMSAEKQKRYYNALDFKGKCCFVQMMYVETGLKFKIPDGQSYWQFKVKCLRRAQAVRAGDRNPDDFPGPRPMGAQSRL